MTANQTAKTTAKDAATIWEQLATMQPITAPPSLYSGPCNRLSYRSV
jgi:hypothetical protein